MLEEGRETVLQAEHGDEVRPPDGDVERFPIRGETDGGGVRPALKGRLPDVGAYDVIFVGSPCWWSTVAPPVATFLADCDWAGKTVVPFMTHEGSRMGRSEEDIRKLCAGATLLGGLPLRGGAVKDSRDVVRKWVQGLNLTK